ncbi:MAG: ATP-binding cassette domain-containing protein [Spirochaetales bacterium]|nr:ATP-binding cassette domain-containing protein [Spirochaetales bacterium]
MTLKEDTISIVVNNLKKTFITYTRGHTFRDAVKSLFKRQKMVVEALKGITFLVEQGELTGFLGPNGAGKSTTLKILTGVLFPTGGDASVLGYIPWKHRKKYVSHIGAVFGQKSQLIWDIPPLDSFYLNRAIYDIDTGKFDHNLNSMTEMLGVRDLIRKPTRELSLGERMKCEFIMAMLHDPKIVFLDEPTIGLDVLAKDKIREFILEKNKLGVTFILTTHDLDDVEHLARRVIVINHGEIVFDDSMERLKSHMGNKKIVHVTTQKNLPPLNEAGITVSNRISEFEAELELDMSQMKLNRFIEDLNKASTISDLSIEQLPIERIIKELYA